MKEVSSSQTIVNLLLKNNFNTVGDIGDIRKQKLTGVGKLNYLAIYSALSVISEINLPFFQNDEHQDETREVSVEYSLHQKKQLMDKFIFKNELSQIPLIDPRFREQRSEIIKIINEEIKQKVEKVYE